MITEQRKSSFWLPSIADILFLSVFLYLSFSAGRGLLNDADTGYHIRAGEFILKTFSIPRHDLFSYITPPLPWTAHEWLSEVIMALVYKASGLTGVVLFFSFLISVVYYVLFKMMRSSRGNILVAVLIIVLAISASPLHWLARPHIFSHLLIVIWYFIIDSYQSGRSNHLRVLPFLTLLWVNLHGGFIIGFIILGTYIFANLLRSILSEGDVKASARDKAWGLIRIAAVCLPVCLINPFGYHILLFPFNLVSQRYLMDHVAEFVSPNFHEPLIFKYLLFLTLALFALSREKISAVELLLVLLFCNMALFSVRHIPLFAIIAAPILTRRADLVLGETDNRFTRLLQTKGENIAAIDMSTKGLLWPILGVLAVVFLTMGGRLNYEFDPKLKPVAAVEFLKKEPIRGNMFNNDEFGDYIIYAASPQYKVFFDGRSDMYGVSRMKEYYKLSNFDPDWDKVLKKYNITWLIFDTKSGLTRYLMSGNDWRLIYSDKIASIFVRNIPEYQYLIEKYRDVKPAPYEDDDEKNSK